MRGLVHRLSSRRGGDEGAVLVMAMIMLTAGMIIIATLTYSVTNDLENSRSFVSSRSLEYAESSAVSQAIQTIRYTPLLGTGQTLNASPPSYCFGSGPTSVVSNIDGGTSIAVWCSTAWDPSSTSTRVVTLSACPSTESAATCSAGPNLRAVVTFDDYPTKVSSYTTGICDAYCGSSMTVQTWDWSPTVPTITTLSTKSGPVTGGTTVTVTGSGFVSGATVSFIEESGGSPTANNDVLAGKSVSVTNSTSLTVVTPSIIDGSTYFVEVTTPSGSTPLSTSAVFSFQPTTPTISAISTTSGTTAGGSSLTITGTGYTTGAVVTFTEESGGTPVSPAVTATGSDLSITSSTSLSVVTPAVSAAGSYFVTVTTTGGTSTESTSYVISLTGLIPTVSSVSPSSGSHSGGTTITITGTGFVTGSTVALVPAYGNHYNDLTCNTVTVASGTAITCITPAGTNGYSYYVEVTNPTGTSSNDVTYSYTY